MTSRAGGPGDLRRDISEEMCRKINKIDIDEKVERVPGRVFRKQFCYYLSPVPEHYDLGFNPSDSERSVLSQQPLTDTEDCCWRN